ncbi:hypothetical protein U9M48_011528, partial [Paspalum notatum var. saurae]
IPDHIRPSDNDGLPISTLFFLLFNYPSSFSAPLLPPRACLVPCAFPVRPAAGQRSASLPARDRATGLAPRSALAVARRRPPLRRAAAFAVARARAPLAVARRPFAADSFPASVANQDPHEGAPGICGELYRTPLQQEFVSQGISFVLGKRKMKDSQGHMIERLEMAASGLELALERSAKMPITDVSLLKRRRMLKCAYLEAMELLDKHKQQPAVPAAAGRGQKQIVQGVKRTRWISNNVPTNSFASLSTDDIRRFEWFADCADKFLRDVEYGCSLRQYTFCSPSIRQLLDGKTLRYRMEQGNHLRCFYVWPACTEDRGVEAVLGYRYEDRTNVEKCFFLLLVLRLSESMDIVQVATKGLQFLTSQFQIVTESALGELTLLPTLLQEVHHSYNAPCLGIQQWHTEQAQQCRPDPVCCKTGRDGICGNNALPHIFFEQLIYLGFQCYVSEPEPTSSSDSGEVDRSISRSGWMPPMSVSTVAFTPHSVHEALQDSSYPVKTIGNVEEPRDGSMLKVAKTIKSDSIKCCGEWGYIKRNCPGLKKDSVSASVASASKSGDSDSDGDLLTVSSEESCEEWLLDSASSFHATPKKELFLSYTEDDHGAFAFLGDGSVYRVMGAGNIKFKTCDGQEVILKGVKHVPGLRRNLISLGLLHDEGWLYQVEPDRRTLKFALERPAKVPITDLSLLRRRKVFRRAYAEGLNLANQKPSCLSCSQVRRIE